MSKAYPEEVKVTTLALIYESGFSSSEAAKHTGISYSTVRRWVKDAQRVEVTKKDKYLLRVMEERLTQLSKERAILRDAAILFAREVPPSSE